ncbi:cysteine desulfurase [Massilia sp. Dwa41.01b]|uniref:cysteine desulfurase n=1 Tax=unclassified Massilia TaxID=2609279 RepID=UPI0016049C44|nr:MULTISPECIES: cysteine desulfurase [unclassified Massilia]QNA87274.1 cysteine desulfurase [Massilia sp. Dwa41.01b]QNA98180.1 cysteine desulfurase [Massilia sp. Se16.2.3]
MAANLLRDVNVQADFFDVDAVRLDFPVLQRHMEPKGTFAYLDNAASGQMPRQVSDRIHRYHTNEHANVHRSVHTLGAEATEAYEGARKKVAAFVNAASHTEILFTRGTTDSINLAMQSYGRPNLQEGDEIIVTTLEHHSNIVPWQMLCKEKKCVLRVVPLNDDGEVMVDEYMKLLNARTRLVAMSHVSNALGSVNPVRLMVAEAKKRGIVTLVDGAQAIPHMAVDVRDLDCDFYAFSGHKLFGPTGIGILYARSAIQERMGPYLGGGDMILRVTFEETIYNVAPYKFEAGTPPIVAAIGLGAAVDYLSAIGMDRIAAYESALLAYADERMRTVPGVRIIGTAAQKAGVLSFMLDDIHPHDVGSLLNSYGVAIRAGHHCAQPVMERFGVPATARASFAFYNTRDEIDALVDGVKHVKRIFAAP